MTEWCPICRSEGEKSESPGNGERTRFDCPRCGRFEVSCAALAALPDMISGNRVLAALISHWVRKKQSVDEWPLVTDSALEQLSSSAKIPTAIEQEKNLLRHLSSLALEPHEWVLQPVNTLMSVVGTSSPSGVQYIIESAVHRGFVRFPGRLGHMHELIRNGRLHLGLTIDGWKEAENINANIGERMSERRSD